MGKFIVTVYNTQNLSLDQIHYKKKNKKKKSTVILQTTPMEITTFVRADIKMRIFCLKE